MTSLNVDMSTQFNRFAGKEVAVTEVTHQTKYGPSTTAQLVRPNPIIEELEQVVADAGLKLRLWLPGQFGTMDFRMDRLNAHVNKEADGKYRIAPEFKLG